MSASGSSSGTPVVLEPRPEHPFSWQYTTPLFIGSALNPINSSLIATALVPIAHGLHVSIGQTAALVTALYLASAIAQPTAGKAAEVLGPRRVFLAGIGLVVGGGLVGGFAQDLVTLLISRVSIGLGTSCAYPTAMLLIRRRARDAGMDKPPGGVLGGLQIAGIATASLGLPLGGVLVGRWAGGPSSSSTCRSHWSRSQRHWPGSHPTVRWTAPAARETSRPVWMPSALPGSRQR